MDGSQYQAKAFTKWVVEQADAYERAHPRTRIPFQRAAVAVRGEGADRKAVSAELDEARAAQKPTLLYFGRDSFDEADKDAKKQAKLARKLEKGTLNSKTAEKEIAGWVLLRFDLADADHALLAKTMGVTEAPALLLFEPGAEAPKPYDERVSAQVLTGVLKKHKVEAEAAAK